MQKVFLKPTTQEIVIKGNSKEGHTDVFAYDYYDDDSRRNLGGLYIVGNIKQEDSAVDIENTPDVAYVINLVASLAKREYYATPDMFPRDAFSATLKKINDVVEEFFKNKSLKINIGIFAVAGEQILISKLGKFKIILGRPAPPAGRESKAIDILNNVDLFSKEQIEEKEFSSVISGKIMAGDRLLAFYPNRMFAAREKTIKAELLKFDSAQFLDKISLIKATKPDFDCGAIYLSINTHKELAIKKQKPIIPINPEKTGTPINFVKADMTKLDPTITESEKNNNTDSQPSLEPAPEVPRIISSEFFLGKKNNPLLASILAPVNILKDLRRNINIKNKIIILSLVAGVLAIGIVLIKTFVVINPEQRQLNTVINQMQNDLKIARTKVNQNDFAGARRLLAESLSNIYAVGVIDDKTRRTTADIYEVLDDIDKAVEVSPSLLELIPAELAQDIAVLDANEDFGFAFDIYERNLYILTNDNILKILDVDKDGQKEPTTWLKSGGLPPEPTMLTADGNIYVMNSSGTLAVYYKGEKVSEYNTFIVSNPGDVLLTSKDSEKLYLVNKTLARIYELDKKSGSLVRTLKVGSTEPFVGAYLVGDSTIIITARDGRIWEIK